MKPFIQLNLRSDSEKTEAANLPRTEGEEPKPIVVGKKLNRMANKAAHKAATDIARGRSNLFSK